MSNFSFPRPEELAPVQARETVDGTCPECGREALKRYPVLAEQGWFMAVKCQECLYSVSRERWTRLGPVTLMTDAIG
jgi:vanillate/4-hydroxybenzoate decarboxylase subunit D